MRERSSRTGRCAPPAPGRPRGCCGESPRAALGAGPAEVFVQRRHAVHIVGADRQRHLRQLRPVERPVHLNRRDVADDQPRQRHALHVVVAGGRHGGIDRPRQRRERPDAADRRPAARRPARTAQRDRRPAADGWSAGRARARRCSPRSIDRRGFCSRSIGASATSSRPAACTLRAARAASSVRARPAVRDRPARIR